MAPINLRQIIPLEKKINYFWQRALCLPWTLSSAVTRPSKPLISPHIALKMCFWGVVLKL